VSPSRTRLPTGVSSPTVPPLRGGDLVAAPLRAAASLGRAAMLPRMSVVGVLLVAAVGAVAASAPARAQVGERAGADDPSYLGAYAILARDAASGQIAVAAASTGFSAGSGIPHLEPGVGAVAVLGRLGSRVGRESLAGMRRGVAPGEAVAAALSEVGDVEGLQVAALDGGCRSEVHTGSAVPPWAGSLRGRAGQICYLAVGSLLADSTVLRELTSSFRSAEGQLLDRLLAGLTGAERAGGEVAPSRSAAIWIGAPDAGSGALGRPLLRLQVEAVQRPAAALDHLARVGRADHLARRASGRVDEGAYEEALEAADRAIEIEPTTALAWLARGRALLYLERDEEAETAFQRMLEVNPYLLHVLGDVPRAERGDRPEGAVPRPRSELIPYRPRLLRRLDIYRRAFFTDADFPADTAGVEAIREEEGAGGGGAEGAG